jgi:hypothetical protein
MLEIAALRIALLSEAWRPRRMDTSKQAKAHFGADGA